MRHERLCHVLKGAVAKCDSCSQTFTSQELVWNAIGNWAQKIHLQNFPIFYNLRKGCVLSKSCVENVSLRFSYDMEYYMRYPLQEMEKILKTIVLLHYMTIDTEGDVSRNQMSVDFLIPKISKRKLNYWWVGHQNHQNGFLFQQISQLHIVNLFLNTNNPIISKIFGYNNNVTMGNHNCIYYVTLYNTKGNQDGEQFPFLKHCTALAKRIRRL
jgi:hypothetical protein